MRSPGLSHHFFFFFLCFHKTSEVLLFLRCFFNSRLKLSNVVQNLKQEGISNELHKKTQFLKESKAQKYCQK